MQGIHARRASSGRSPRGAAVLLGLLVAGHSAVLATAAESHMVVQRNRAFSLREIVVKAGDTLRFSNDDEFLHQIYVTSPALTFDSAEQPPGQVIDVKLSASGMFEVQCHIHPKMHLNVTVQ
jgi:plastocyanin